MDTYDDNVTEKFLVFEKVHCMDLFTAAQTNDKASLAERTLVDEHGMVLKDTNGVSLALHALYAGNRPLAEWIASRCAYVDSYTAAALNIVSAVRRSIDNQDESIHAPNGDGFHMLGLACYFGAENVVSLLLQAGANPNIPSQNAFAVAPIHSATAANSLSLVELLIAAGADVNVVQQNGFTPLHAAAQHGNLTMVQVLLAAGADVTACSTHGKSAADYARESNHETVSAYLTQIVSPF